MKADARLFAVGLLSCVLAAGVAAGPSGPDAARARLHFVQHCTGCHLADGSGAPSNGVPSMRGALGQFLKVPGGREFIVQVPGVMNTPLDNRDVANLMNWLLFSVSSNALSVDIAPYTADEIARLRKSRPANVAATREQLIARMGEAGIAPTAASTPLFGAKEGP